MADTSAPSTPCGRSARGEVWAPRPRPGARATVARGRGAHRHGLAERVAEGGGDAEGGEGVLPRSADLRDHALQARVRGAVRVDAHRERGRGSRAAGEPGSLGELQGTEWGTANRRAGAGERPLSGFPRTLPRERARNTPLAVEEGPLMRRGVAGEAESRA